MSLDLSQDYLLIDDTVTITYLSKTGEGTYAAPVTVPYAARFMITKKDLEANPGLLEKQTMGFNLWTANLATTVPKIGDKLTDNNSIVWIVSVVDMCDQDGGGIQRYRCLCIKAVV